jgi:hypothetical protein
MLARRLRGCAFVDDPQAAGERIPVGSQRRGRWEEAEIGRALDQLKVPDREKQELSGRHRRKEVRGGWLPAGTGLNQGTSQLA